MFLIKNNYVKPYLPIKFGGGKRSNVGGAVGGDRYRSRALYYERAEWYNGVPFPPAKMAEIVADLSRGLEKQDGDTALRRDSLLFRALFEEQLGRYDEARADIKAAEDLGEIDLSRIIPLESGSLIGRGRPEDLRRVISLLNFGLGLKLSSVLNIPASESDWRIHYLFALLDRAQAYYKLGEFNNAIGDCKQALAAEPTSAMVPNLFEILIFAYVRLGNMTEALQPVLNSFGKEIIPNQVGYKRF